MSKNDGAKGMGKFVYFNSLKLKSRDRYVLNMKNKSRDMNQGCSCTMCGNPRKWFGSKTLQEMKEAA